MWHKERVEIIKHSWDFLVIQGVYNRSMVQNANICSSQHRHTEDTSSFLQRNNMRRVLGLHS